MSLLQLKHYLSSQLATGVSVEGFAKPLACICTESLSQKGQAEVESCGRVGLVGFSGDSIA